MAVTSAWAIWVTGLPGSGKTAVSQRVKELLKERDIQAKILELDELRRVITPSPRYSEAERDIVYASLAYMAKLLTEAGVNVIIDATGCKLRYRELARGLISKFAEVYLDCPLKDCIRRERGRKARFSPRDIYEKAQKKGDPVPGVNVPYEEPEAPEIYVDRRDSTIEKDAQKIVEGIEKLFL